MPSRNNSTLGKRSNAVPEYTAADGRPLHYVSEPATWAAAQLKKVLSEAQRRKRRAKLAEERSGDQRRVQSGAWAAVCGTLGVAIAEMENSGMPWPLRKQAHALSDLLHDDFLAEAFAAAAREAEAEHGRLAASIAEAESEGWLDPAE